ncbi:MAG: porin, partial [Alphaproteobacteria bacterium]
VYFKMRGELDNGLKIGGRFELEGDNGGDQLDQVFLTLSGGFGQLRLGAVNSGRYSYGWNTDAPAVGVPINSGWISTFVAAQNNSGFRFRSPGLSTVIDGSNDEQKITYFTPRFNGFQLTGSWTPEAHNINSNSVGQGGESFRFTGPSDENILYTNGWDFGASYSGDFNGAGVELQAGIFGSTAPNNAEAAGFDDYFGFNGGLSLSYQGFSIAGSFAKVVDGLAFCPGGGTCVGNGALASNEGHSYNAGIGYSTGPYSFSATWFRGEEEGLLSQPGDEKNQFFNVAASYTLGPGIRTSLTYLHAELDDDTAGNANSADNEGDAVIWGMHLGF